MATRLQTPQMAVDPQPKSLPGPPRTPTPRMDWTWRAIVLDDNTDDVELLRLHALAMRGPYLTLETCATAEELATRLLVQPTIDLVLLDYRLEHDTALDVLQRVRAAGQTLPIVVLTGHADMDVALAVMRAGASDFLTKQELTPATLARTVRIVMDKALAERRLADTLAVLERSRDDMASVLNGLRLAVVMTDERGLVTYINNAAERLLDCQAPLVLRTTWQQLWHVSSEALARLKAMMDRPAEQRELVTLHVRPPSGDEHWLDVEVQDDPRDPRRKMLLAYDVSEVHDLRKELAQHAPPNGLIGQSEAIQRVHRAIRDLAGVDSTVLIVGETGTGKELVARALHASSTRRDKPFVAINCAGLTESLLASQLFGHKRGAFTGATADQKGLFVAADGGTILLDEIGDIPPSVQTALLRVLQEREVTPLGETVPRHINVRVLAATHRNLQDLVEKGAFRADLLYRIRVARIDIPALRERRGDIPVLAEHFLAKFRSRRASSESETANQRLSRPAMLALCAYGWPGNVRELRSAVEYASIRSRHRVVQVEDLPPEVVESQPASVHALPLDDDRARIEQALVQTGGSRSKAATLLGWSRATFYRRLAELDLQPPHRRRF